VGPAYEICPEARSRNDFFGALRALRSQRPPGDGFLLLRAPDGLSAPEVLTAAAYAAEAGVEARLCLAYSIRPRDEFGPALGAAINDAGLRAALDDLDVDCSFADLIRNPVCAVLPGERLVRAALSDPATASALEAMARLAANLGMLTVATCSPVAGRAALAELGVDYIGENCVADVRDRRESAEFGQTSNRPRYQGALYGP
jgi:hypothetical protein